MLASLCLKHARGEVHDSLMCSSVAANKRPQARKHGYKHRRRRQHEGNVNCLFSLQDACSVFGHRAQRVNSFNFTLSRSKLWKAPLKGFPDCSTCWPDVHGFTECCSGCVDKLLQGVERVQF